MYVFGTHDEKTLAQARDVASRADRFALMADGHLGYIMPIGGVAAYRNRVSPVGVGVDIGCGNLAIMTDLRVENIIDYLEEYADTIANYFSFGAGGTNLTGTDDAGDLLFDSDEWYAFPPEVRNRLRELARAQLGSVGGGNHYVDVFGDDNGHVWVGVHFGSRGLGYITAHGFMALAQNEEWTDLKPRPNMNQEVLLDVDTELGNAYMIAMGLAGEYACAGREWVARTVVDILGGKELDFVHNHHNFAWREEHEGEEFIVVRKGATPAFPGQRGFVGGSMGDKSVILRGVRRDETTLCSTIHGAGRIMSRSKARGKWKNGVCVRPGSVSIEEMQEATRGVVVRGGDLDEAPQVYRRLDDALMAQGNTIEVSHILHPLIVCMAPARTQHQY